MCFYKDQKLLYDSLLCMCQARDTSPMAISELNKYYTACVKGIEINELVLRQHPMLNNTKLSFLMK